MLPFSFFPSAMHVKSFCLANLNYHGLFFKLLYMSLSLCFCFVFNVKVHHCDDKGECALLFNISLSLFEEPIG